MSPEADGFMPPWAEWDFNEWETCTDTELLLVRIARICNDSLNRSCPANCGSAFVECFFTLEPKKSAQFVLLFSTAVQSQHIIYLHA